MKPAIRVESLSKRYFLGSGAPGGYRTLRESITQAARAPYVRLRKWLSPRHTATSAGSALREIWALRDVSFEVQPGEVIGLVGPNGAGKSTLLKILSRIVEPCGGRVELRGRLRSLLEVGTGFHPELTGRENIFLNGVILGMSRQEVRRRFDEIVEFSGIGPFLDTPVKRYSSGMYVRLAFSVAAHLEPEILLLDEVLAVGDTAFQKKCLGKMGEVAREGRTVLLVSHNMQAVAAFAHKCLHLAGGTVRGFGRTQEILAAYQQDAASPARVYRAEPAAAEPRITRAELRTALPDNVQPVKQSMEIHLEVATPWPIRGARLMVQALSAYLQPVFVVWTFDADRPFCRTAGTHRAVCRIPSVRLAPGRYSLRVHLTEFYGGRRFERLEGVCPFTVVAQKEQVPSENAAFLYFEDCAWEVAACDAPGPG